MKDAQKWMEYRYRTGDGVPINLEQADKWMKIYQGIALEVPVIDND